MNTQTNGQTNKQQKEVDAIKRVPSSRLFLLADQFLLEWPAILWAVCGKWKWWMSNTVTTVSLLIKRREEDVNVVLSMRIGESSITISKSTCPTFLLLSPSDILFLLSWFLSVTKGCSSFIHICPTSTSKSQLPSLPSPPKREVWRPVEEVFWRFFRLSNSTRALSNPVIVCLCPGKRVFCLCWPAHWALSTISPTSELQEYFAINCPSSLREQTERKK